MVISKLESIYVIKTEDRRWVYGAKLDDGDEELIISPIQENVDELITSIKDNIQAVGGTPCIFVEQNAFKQLRAPMLFEGFTVNSIHLSEIPEDLASRKPHLLRYD